MDKIIEFFTHPLCVRNNHGGASKEGQPPPNAEQKPIINLRRASSAELEEFLDAAERGDAADGSTGNVLITFDEADELLGGDIKKRAPKRRSKRRAPRPKPASGTS